MGVKMKNAKIWWVNAKIWWVLALIAFCMVAPAAAAPEPFMVYGYVFYENETACNNPTVNITNLNTSVKWQAETNATSNYYQLVLANGTNVNASEVLQFNVTSPDGSQSNVTNHTVTPDEIASGGIFNFNITLASEAPPGVCGDVTGDTMVDMNDVIRLLWNQTYAGQYPVDSWSADVTGDTMVDMNDVIRLLWNQTYAGQYPLNCV